MLQRLTWGAVVLICGQALACESASFEGPTSGATFVGFAGGGGGIVDASPNFSAPVSFGAEPTRLPPDPGPIADPGPIPDPARGPIIPAADAGLDPDPIWPFDDDDAGM